MYSAHIFFSSFVLIVQIISLVFTNENETQQNKNDKNVGKIVEGLTMTTALYLNSGGRFF
jgi:hypothetical protein